MLSLVTILVAAAPAIDLYTFGPGDDVFSHFGHSAICVGPRCYNFGTADFDTPIPLTRNFIRGQATFWVSVVARDPMLAFYRQSDRTTWRQRLVLTTTQAHQLAADLEASTRGERRYYLYHHYFDNCTTRIRDAIERAAPERLGMAPRAAEPADTFRDVTRRGFAGQPPLLLLTALILGRPADRAMTAREALFLPAALMSAVDAPAEAEYVRRGPLPPSEAPPAEWLFAALGALVGAIVARASSDGRLARALAGALLGAIALVPWALAAASAFPELRDNEALLVLWPTDLLLGMLRGRALSLYARARLGGLALVLSAHAVGLLVQPLAPLIVLAALPLAAVVYAGREAAALAPGITPGHAPRA